MEWESLLKPLVSPLGLEIYDVEFAGGTLHVMLRRDGGVDLDALAEASRAISAWLDANDPIEGRYTLDVSSPGLERRLRTPAHFSGAVGEIVTLRERREGEATRRLEGVLVESDEGTVTIDDAELGPVTVAFEAIERARTVFRWGTDAPASPKVAKGAVAKGAVAKGAVAKGAAAKGAASKTAGKTAAGKKG